MIKVNRVGGEVIYINSSHIESFEPNSEADTTIRIHNGTTYIVQEKPEEIVRLVDEAEHR